VTSKADTKQKQSGDLKLDGDLTAWETSEPLKALSLDNNTLVNV